MSDVTENPASVTFEPLLAEAERCARFLNRDEILAEIDDPERRPFQKTHDWRNHLPEAIFEVWEDLPIEARP